MNKKLILILISVGLLTLLYFFFFYVKHERSEHENSRGIDVTQITPSGIESYSRKNQNLASFDSIPGEESLSNLLSPALEAKALELLIAYRDPRFSRAEVVNVILGVFPSGIRSLDLEMVELLLSSGDEVAREAVIGFLNDMDLSVWDAGDVEKLTLLAFNYRLTLRSDFFRSAYESSNSSLVLMYAQLAKASGFESESEEFFAERRAFAMAGLRGAISGLNSPDFIEQLNAISESERLSRKVQANWALYEATRMPESIEEIGRLADSSIWDFENSGYRYDDEIGILISALIAMPESVLTDRLKIMEQGYRSAGMQLVSDRMLVSLFFIHNQTEYVERELLSRHAESSSFPNSASLIAAYSGNLELRAALQAHNSSWFEYEVLQKGSFDHRKWLTSWLSPLELYNSSELQ
jgi:hypothetical protein